jgi:hypothetical protein
VPEEPAAYVHVLPDGAAWAVAATTIRAAAVASAERVFMKIVLPSTTNSEPVSL